MQASVQALGSLVPIFLNIDACPPPLAHASSIISPLKVVSLARAKPHVSNRNEPILITCFFISFILWVELLLKLSQFAITRHVAFPQKRATGHRPTSYS